MVALLYEASLVVRRKRIKRSLFEPFYTNHESFYQDRLRRDIGEHSKRGLCVFLQETTPLAKPPSLLNVRRWLKVLIDRSLILGTVDRPSLHDLVRNQPHTYLSIWWVGDHPIKLSTVISPDKTIGLFQGSSPKHLA
jgi:hypothetical protein